jgi:hypothetical protein
VHIDGLSAESSLESGNDIILVAVARNASYVQLSAEQRKALNDVQVASKVAICRRTSFALRSSGLKVRLGRSDDCALTGAVAVVAEAAFGAAAAAATGAAAATATAEGASEVDGFADD